MTIQHLTLAKFRIGMTTEQMEEAYKTIHRLMQGALLVPGVKSFTSGPPMDRKGTRGYQVALIVDFENMQAFRAYIPHPHHRLMADFVYSIAQEKPLSYQIDTDQIAKL
ncbi:Stress-response A/B barrel domain-containing protein [Mycena indigotica]|uniref:Stress-response A/B barrel domain-containing protein n=1 Tax=Mycena indigotica TaxID=2126181 RepID=A0A8H6SR27_9AGAR|nr:Stress-response A/B barrel domain-containing protein [Mycena indigotica]KAF7303844.1 Stress-response A/B barrel domain-containing protein [Mycena indigotica]